LKNTLEKLCTKLPTNWKAKCSDFVTNNLESILDMLIAQIPPQEICVLLNICTPKTISDSAANEIGM
jgi:saposin